MAQPPFADGRRSVRASAHGVSPGRRGNCKTGARRVEGEDTSTQPCYGRIEVSSWGRTGGGGGRSIEGRSGSAGVSVSGRSALGSGTGSGGRSGSVGSWGRAGSGGTGTTTFGRGTCVSAWVGAGLLPGP